MSTITASMLYDLVQCPHRLTMEVFGDPAKRDPESAFIELLWEWGNAFEQETIEKLKISYLNLLPHTNEERERMTLAAMRRGERLIYGGRIRAGDLLGDPDLLRREGDGYVAGDIKSGAGVEGVNEDADGKPKKHYAVQLALYTDILERLGLLGLRSPFIWDVHGQEVVYNLDAPLGPRTPDSLWDFYQATLAKAQMILNRSEQTLPALGGKCKLCHWRTGCTRRVEELDDLTQIPELGRAYRDAMLLHISSVSELAKAKTSTLIQGDRTVFRGVGVGTLMKFQSRAKLQKQQNPIPYLTAPIELPVTEIELFFDVESDPMRDVCYLHGFVERHRGDKDTEKYVSFFADQPGADEEKKAFSEAWEYIQSRMPCAVYYYSPYERTWWRKLQARYPTVATAEDLEAIFSAANTVDLYHDVVKTRTEWPTRDYSIKTLASYLGFNWRDKHPSGAESIEWYHRWLETGDGEIRQRILEYNEDDCIAMRVLLDAISELEVS